MPSNTPSTLGLADAIADLRGELTRAMAAGRDETLQFELGAVEIELLLQLQMAAGAKVGLKWVVVSVDTEASGQMARTHRVKLTLTPRVGGQSVKVGGAVTNRPE